MAYLNRQPGLLLKDSIVCFWAAERELTDEAPQFNLLPDAYIELVFCFGENQIWYETENEKKPLPEVFILGLQQKPLRIISKGYIRAVGIRFYAWGYAEILNRNPAGLFSAVPDMLMQRKEAIQEDFLKGNLNACWDILETDCISLLALNKQNPQNILQKAFGLLRLPDSPVKVQELAKACGVSTRHLLRLFNEHIGTSPKAFSKNIRFQKARDAIFENPDQSLTELAYECGYSDQSHFIRDFYFFYGKKPKAFVEEMRMLRQSLINSEMIRNA